MRARKCFTKNRIHAISLSLAESDLRVVAERRAARGKDRKFWVSGVCPQPETRVKGRGIFFIFFSRNSLKSPDSAKGIQGNPSFFPWFYLDLLGFIWSEFALWFNQRAGRG
jgi:hypothetical protein